MAAPPAVIPIEGEAGIGKTRLLQEFLSATHGDTRRTLVAPCPPFREPHTLGPVADALRQVVDDVAAPHLSPLGGTLRPLFPEWSANLPTAPEPADDASSARHRVFRALTELLGRLEIELLVVEDVHWADEATLEFLLHLVTQRPQRISLILTYRSEEITTESPVRRLSSRVSRLWQPAAPGAWTARRHRHSRTDVVDAGWPACICRVRRLRSRAYGRGAAGC